MPSFARSRSVTRCCALLFGVGLSICVHPALAQDLQRVEFDIPAQAIDGALDRFAAASGFQVFYETALTAGHHSQSIKGVFDPAAALHLLLEGSGLTGKFIGPNTITITQTAEIGPALLSAKRAALAYYGVIQAAVTAALCQSTNTRPGSYRVAIQYWIGSSGEVSRVRLIGSSGDGARDDAIIRAIQMVVLQPQLSQLPQPVTLAIEPGERGGSAACVADQR
jgi:Secretin and TonB N terminus short domain/TonB C terminal